MQIGHNKTKSIQQYRHNIKLLKYHLKKQQRINETLKYKSMANQKKSKLKDQAINKPKQRIYSMLDTVTKLSKRVKQMGLVLGDLFRMADAKYDGQITKGMFMKVISGLKSDLDDNLINEMFYAIDTNTNNVLDEDQYLEFLCAYGGAELKDANRFQKKSLQKFAAILRRKSIDPQTFLAESIDPISVYDFKKKIAGYGLNDNEVMILLKAFDPSNEGKINHELFIEQMKTVKQKNQQTIKNEAMEKDIKYMCVQWRQKKINPIKIFEQADVDEKDGITPLQLEQAFEKLMPNETKFNIKKWVKLINLDNNEEITREQFVNSIRCFYALNQLDKFSSEYEKQNPNAKRALANEQPAIEPIIKQLEQKIEDAKMTKTEAFHAMDINHDGMLNKEQLAEGLKKFGFNILFIGRVLSVFDRNKSQGIQLDQWLHVLGQDVEMEDVPEPADDDEDAEQAKKTVKKGLKPVINKETKKVDDKKKDTKKEQKSVDDSTKPSIKKKEDGKKPQTKFIKKDKQNQEDKPEQKQIKKKAKQSKVEKSEQKELRKKDQSQDKKNKSSKKFIDEEVQDLENSQLPQSSKLMDSTKKLSDKKIRRSIKEDKPFEPPKKPQVDIKQLEQKVAVEYKKRPETTLSKFKKFNQKDKITIKIDDFKAVLKEMKVAFTQKKVSKIFEDNATNDLLKYKKWLDSIAEKYAQNVEKQEQDNPKKDSPPKSTFKQKKSKRGLEQGQMEESKKQIQNEFQKVKELESQDQVHSKDGYKLSNFIDSPQQISLLNTKYLPKAEQIKKDKEKFKDGFTEKQQSIPKKKGCSIQNAEHLCWKHYSKVFKNPVLFEGAIQPNDIKQGGLGNCYFLSALACLAQYSNLIERLFEYYDIQNGYFLIWLCIDGLWKLYEIDGNIVCDPTGKTPYFSHTDKQELWVILLQKAYAKAYGCYENISGGDPCSAITDLSGSPGERFSHSKVNQNQLWDKLVEANNNKFIMAAGTQSSKGQQIKIQGRPQGVTSQGLTLGHAYSILDVQQVGKQKIIQLRNPWGHTQWNGEWSDKDPSNKWTQKVRQQLNYSNSGEDGIFWMPFSAFFSRYNQTSINYLRPTYYFQAVEQPKSKLLLVKISGQQLKQGYLSITQRDQRHQGLSGGNSYVSINVSCLICEKGSEQVKFIRKVEDLRVGRSKETQIVLNNLKSNQEVVAIVRLDQETNVNVSFYSNCKTDFTVESMEEDDERQLSYCEAIAFGNSEKSQKTQGFSYWMSNVGNKVFFCLKNESSPKTKVTIKFDKPNNIEILPPQKLETTLEIKKGQTKSVRGLLKDEKLKFSFGSIGLVI